MKMRRSLLGLVTVAALGAMIGTAYAAGLWGNLPMLGGAGESALTGSEDMPMDTNLSGGRYPQSQTATLLQLQAFYQPFNSFRNYLDNGAMDVAARGTAAVTGGTTSGCPSSTYVADRWCVDTNVGSGAGKAQVVTSGPTPPTGFTNSVNVYRNAATLTQPVCYIQEIPTNDSTQLAGQTVTLSYYAQALAGAPALSTVNPYVIYGTGSDQGLGTMTASPAITPAWTGVASLGGAGQVVTTSWVRYTAPAVVIPSTATEVGVEICFTPGTETAGATDGFSFTGIQLEVGTAASSYEFRPLGVEIVKAQRFYYQIAEVAGAVFAPGFVSATNVERAVLAFPVTMRATPTCTYTAGGFKWEINGTQTAVSTLTQVTGTTAGYLTIGDTATGTAGQTAFLTGSATTGLIQCSADF